MKNSTIRVGKPFVHASSIRIQSSNLAKEREANKRKKKSDFMFGAMCVVGAVVVALSAAYTINNYRSNTQNNNAQVSSQSDYMANIFAYKKNAQNVKIPKITPKMIKEHRKDIMRTKIENQRIAKYNKAHPDAELKPMLIPEPAPLIGVIPGKGPVNIP